ncbi:MAG TPA: tripartite tricarboxylate transporter substrate binding protein [Xanthobacteraceae bacterium]|nr:tripartite tricarboxylate transporter substrate binding protein [Xanthobacteraceae bacterium]
MSLALPTAALAQSAPAATWPIKPIRLISPLPAGSAVDLVGRLIGQKLGARLGQTIVVEDRPGASGAIGTEAVVRAAPDGYTLGMATSTTLATAPVLNPKLPYDPIKDVTPVALVGVSPYVLVANAGLPAQNVAELIALAKQKPGVISYSSVGEASLAHLAGLLFSSMAGVELNHIPYKSSTHAVIDLNEGRIDLQFGIIPTTLQFVRAGKLRALAVTTEKRLDELPDVPTFEEAGLKGFEASLWFAVIAPKGMPAGIVAKLNREIAAVVAEPDVKTAWAAQGIFPQSSTSAALGERIARDLAKWRGVASGLKVKDE